MPLGFYRGVRQKSIDCAKKHWRRLPPVSANHYGIDDYAPQGEE